MDKILNPFWLRFVELLPTTMAPNMVTLLGTLGNASMVLALVLMDTSFKKELHMLFYYLASFSIFFYQTMDAVDGK